MTTPLTKADLDRFEALASKCIWGSGEGLVVVECPEAAALAAGMPAMIAALREAVELLRRVEWTGHASGECGVCGRMMAQGHAPNCALAAFLSRFA